MSTPDDQDGVAVATETGSSYNLGYEYLRDLELHKFLFKVYKRHFVFITVTIIYLCGIHPSV